MYKINFKRVNDLAIIVIDGKIYNRTSVTDEVWIKIIEGIEEVNQAQGSDTIEDLNIAENNLYDLIIPSRVVKREQEEAAKQAVVKEAELDIDFDTRMRKAKRIADISGLFEYDEEGVTYLKGFRQPMPKLLVEALLDAHYNPSSNYTVNSLINFWKYLLLNPDRHVRTGLFQWIKTGKFAITEDGNIISYRNVDVKKASITKNLQDFISESWTKVKKWKKSPKNYSIQLNDRDNNSDPIVYTLVETSKINTNYQVVGVLSELYSDLDTKEDVTIYTDQHTHTMEIKLGEVVSIDRQSCDNDPNASCSRGLHQKSAAHGWNFGSNAIVCLVNPYHVVAIPSYDHSKFRTCQYLPVSKAEVTNYSIVEFEPGTYDIPYNGLETLVDLLKTESLEDLQAKGEISDELDTKDFDFVMKVAKDTISKRVVKL